MTALGWKLLDVTPSLISGDVKKLRDFGRGYALRMVQGAQHVAAISLRNGNETQLVTSELYDGRIVACPGAFDEVEITWPDDVFPGLTRVTLEVLMRPAIVQVAGADKGMLSARRVFPSVLHANPPVTTGLVNVAAAGGFAVVCDVPGALWQFPSNTGPGLVTPYISRHTGDERAPWWPAADVFFDGYIAGQDHNSFEVWIYAYSFTNSSTPRLHFYRRLAGVESESGGPPTTLPAQTGRHVQRLTENSGIALPCPPDGFQVLVKNTHATVVLTIGGYIGARAT